MLVGEYGISQIEMGVRLRFIDINNTTEKLRTLVRFIQLSDEVGRVIGKHQVISLFARRRVALFIYCS